MSEQETTSRRARELLTVLQYRHETYPPTFEELRLALKWSTKSLVSRYLDELESMGCVTIEHGTPRGVHLAPPFIL